MEHYGLIVQCSPSLCAQHNVSCKLKQGPRRLCVIVWSGRRTWQAEVKRHLALAAVDVLNKQWSIQTGQSIYFEESFSPRAYTERSFERLSTLRMHARLPLARHQLAAQEWQITTLCRSQSLLWWSKGSSVTLRSCFHSFTAISPVVLTAAAAINITGLYLRMWSQPEGVLGRRDIYTSVLLAV